MGESAATQIVCRHGRYDATHYKEHLLINVATTRLGPRRRLHKKEVPLPMPVQNSHRASVGCTRQITVPLPPLSGYKPVRQVDLGTTLRQLRKEQGLTVEALAFNAGCHQTYLSRVELGEVSVGWAKLTGIAAALNTSLSAIMREAEERRIEAVSGRAALRAYRMALMGRS